MSTSTDWSSRPALSALSAERLAALVDRAASRTEAMLFTATPREELDRVGQWQRLQDLAFAGQMREIVAGYNRASVEQREFAADEVGLAIGATSTTGGNLVAQALGLAALPGLLEAVEDGVLTQRHVLAVLRELDRVELSGEQRHAVVLLALARYGGQAPGELATVIRRLIITVDRAAAAAREAEATTKRRVWFTPDVDGQASMTARGPAATIAAIRAALEAGLSTQPEPGDERTREAREFDLFVALLTGGAQAGHWHAEVIVPFSVTQGGDLELAEIPGLGPILPSAARDLLGQCDTAAPTAVDGNGTVIGVSDPVRLRKPPEPQPQPALEAEPVRLQLPDRFTTPPSDGQDLAGSGYRFPPRLRRYLEARDRTCVFPGCRRRARRTDKDHRIPWPIGPTSAENGQCLCRHHHRAKHKVFTVLHDPHTGDYLWITRGGWQFRRHPQGF